MCDRMTPRPSCFLGTEHPQVLNVVPPQGSQGWLQAQPSKEKFLTGVPGIPENILPALLLKMFRMSARNPRSRSTQSRWMPLAIKGRIFILAHPIIISLRKAYFIKKSSHWIKKQTNKKLAISHCYSHPTIWSCRQGRLCP